MQIKDLTTTGTAVADTDFLAGETAAGVTYKITGASVRSAVLGATTLPQYLFNLPDGTMLNGKIVPTVVADDLVLTLQTLAGNAPSATEKVWVKINGTWRSVSAALSVTKADATNWANLGSAELATKEVDLFAYLGYNATDGVVLGWSRIPYARLYSDFSATTTNEKYAAISTITNAAAGDSYVNIGRFAATLSAGAGYTWTVPTYTTANLIQRPIFETRWLTWAPTYTGSGSLTYGTVTTNLARYKIIQDRIKVEHQSVGTTGGTANTTIYTSAPFTATTEAYNVPLGTAFVADGSTAIAGFTYPAATRLYGTQRYDGANFGLGANRYNVFSGEVSIA